MRAGDGGWKMVVRELSFCFVGRCSLGDDCCLAEELGCARLPGGEWLVIEVNVHGFPVESEW